MDINDLFDGIAEAFRRYQQEIADNEGTMHKGCMTGLAIVFPYRKKLPLDFKQLI